MSLLKGQAQLLRTHLAAAGFSSRFATVNPLVHCLDYADIAVLVGVVCLGTSVFGFLIGIDG